MNPQPLFYPTPLLENLEINQRLGKRVFLKMECYQPVGSFKARGIGTLCQYAVERDHTHLVSSSGGNAGLAAAYAGSVLGAKVTVVCPERTSELAKRRIQALGAELIVYGAAWDDANQRAMEIVEEGGGFLIHPFDHPAVWAGHSTIIDEVITQAPKPDRVVISVGGGGLLAGVVEGLQRHGWGDIPVLAVETEGAESFAKSLAANQIVTLHRIESIATTLGARTITRRALDLAQVQPISSVVVSDSAAVEAALAFADDQRVVVEPACGASLALLYSHVEALGDAESVLIIVCGGAGVTVQQLLDWQKQL